LLSQLFSRRHAHADTPDVPDFPERADLAHLSDQEAEAAPALVGLRFCACCLAQDQASVYTPPSTPEGKRPRWKVWETTSGPGCRVELEPWAMGRGRWAVGDGPWAMGRGRWAVGDGPWAMGVLSPRDSAGREDPQGAIEGAAWARQRATARQRDSARQPLIQPLRTQQPIAHQRAPRGCGDVAPPGAWRRAMIDSVAPLLS
jgi:hypothetical protein